MSRITAPLPAALLLAAPLWLAACGGGQGVPENRTVAEGPAAAVAEPVASANISMVDRADSPNATNAADNSAALDPSSEAAKGKPGARAVLKRWADALGRRDWATARLAWGHGGADSGLDPDAFARAYDKYRDLTVTYGDGDVEGGAGSLYYEVPVTVTGTLRDGRSVRMEGPVVLRRVNDVDGSSAEDRMWHISQSDLKPRP